MASEQVWGAPQPAQRWGARETVTAVGVAVVIAALGGAAIYAATGSHAQQSFGHGPPGPPPGGFASAQMMSALPALHGELVVEDGKGGYSSLLTQIGTVTAMSPTSITVRSADAFTQTYDLQPTTRTTLLIAVNDEVSVQATRNGHAVTADTVDERIGPVGPAGPPGPTPHN
ncbi:hypothetical protein BST36_12310 [Mycolicibacterium moriokaense]|nr:hypothetical protein [Mycolicibacterium moriokaense]MCV7042687.1 hypothetical protein [Mycolicibacterium moriokaense]ORB23406.1 hypothetical protein BST36_12310 [Mycolicibacterium moriokaense]